MYIKKFIENRKLATHKLRTRRRLGLEDQGKWTRASIVVMFKTIAAIETTKARPFDTSYITSSTYVAVVTLTSIILNRLQLIITPFGWSFWPIIFRRCTFNTLYIYYHVCNHKLSIALWKWFSILSWKTLVFVQQSKTVLILFRYYAVHSCSITT